MTTLTLAHGTPSRQAELGSQPLGDPARFECLDHGDCVVRRLKPENLARFEADRFDTHDERLLGHRDAALSLYSGGDRTSIRELLGIERGPSTRSELSALPPALLLPLVHGPRVLSTGATTRRGMAVGGVGELHVFCPECWEREFGEGLTHERA